MSTPIHYDQRLFRSVANSANGEVSGQTLFTYFQEADLLWGTYRGGAVRFGTLTGRVLTDGSLDFAYQHLNQENELMTGRCLSQPERLPDGRLRLHERWRWTCRDFSEGESVIESVLP